MGRIPRRKTAKLLVGEVPSEATEAELFGVRSRRVFVILWLRVCIRRTNMILSPRRRGIK